MRDSKLLNKRLPSLSDSKITVNYRLKVAVNMADPISLMEKSSYTQKEIKENEIYNTSYNALELLFLD